MVRTLCRVYPRDGFQEAVLREGSIRTLLCWPRRETTVSSPNRDPASSCWAIWVAWPVMGPGHGSRGSDGGVAIESTAIRPVALGALRSGDGPGRIDPRLDDRSRGKAPSTPERPP